MQSDWRLCRLLWRRAAALPLESVHADARLLSETRELRRAGPLSLAQRNLPSEQL